MEQLDVIVVGAGISGISAAVHLSRSCPQKQVCILERREKIGVLGICQSIQAFYPTATRTPQAFRLSRGTRKSLFGRPVDYAVPQ